MKEKALGNINVAQLLLNKSGECYSNTSVHCSYYAVFQYMKYILAKTDKMPISYEDQDSKQGVDSHNFILEEVKKRIDNTTNKRRFAQQVRLLRNSRIRADYKSEVIMQNEGLECKQQAEACISKLKQFFGNI